MCGTAALAYAIFIGRDKLPPALQMKMKKHDDLERKVSTNDHRGVFKIWQRLKSLDGAPHNCLPGVVSSMQQLGKPASEILAELKSALECNAAISDGLVELLESLQRNGKGDEMLVSGVAVLLEECKNNSGSAGTDD